MNSFELQSLILYLFFLFNLSRKHPTPILSTALVYTLRDYFRFFLTAFFIPSGLVSPTQLSSAKPPKEIWPSCCVRSFGNRYDWLGGPPCGAVKLPSLLLSGLGLAQLRQEVSKEYRAEDCSKWWWFSQWSSWFWVSMNLPLAQRIRRRPAQLNKTVRSSALGFMKYFTRVVGMQAWCESLHSSQILVSVFVFPR